MNARMGAKPWQAHTYHDRARLFLAPGGDGDLERALSDLEAAEAMGRHLRMAWLLESADQA